jgi:hypothetical protein
MIMVFVRHISMYRDHRALNRSIAGILIPQRGIKNLNLKLLRSLRSNDHRYQKPESNDRRYQKPESNDRRYQKPESNDRRYQKPEFLNSYSSLLYILFSLYTINRNFHGLPLYLYALQNIIGIGSYLFHWYGTIGFGNLDMDAMLMKCFISNIIVWEVITHKNKLFIMLSHLIGILFLILSLSFSRLNDVLIGRLIFGLTFLPFLIGIFLLWIRSFHKRNDEEKKAFHIFFKGLLVLILGSIIWGISETYCYDLPLWVALLTHPLWHGFTAYGIVQIDLLIIYFYITTFHYPLKVHDNLLGRLEPIAVEPNTSRELKNENYQRFEWDSFVFSFVITMFYICYLCFEIPEYLIGFDMHISCLYWFLTIYYQKDIMKLHHFICILFAVFYYLGWYEADTYSRFCITYLPDLFLNIYLYARGKNYRFQTLLGLIFGVCFIYVRIYVNLVYLIPYLYFNSYIQKYLYVEIIFHITFVIYMLLNIHWSFTIIKSIIKTYTRQNPD